MSVSVRERAFAPAEGVAAYSSLCGGDDVRASTRHSPEPMT